jgi:hypothetical protein
LKCEATSNLLNGAAEPPAQNIRERDILDSNDNLPARPANGRKNFDKIQRPIIVDMLDGIVQQE